MEDMEFFQFHPTGIYKKGILLSEAARGEGGILLNDRGERFMERYSPNLKDLAPRDIVSRCIYLEVHEGRGIGGQDYVHLDLRHLDRKTLDEKLPDITDFVRIYMGLEPARDLIPIQPTAHYAMGGLPTDIDARVVIDDRQTWLRGLYAAGEAACVSVHGANRLGTNSLVDIIVFGRRGGRHMAEYAAHADWEHLPPGPEGFAQEQIARLMSSSGGEKAPLLLRELRHAMSDRAGVYRTEAGLRQLLESLDDLSLRYRRVQLDDHGKCFNTELTEALEVGYLIDIARNIAVAALARQETRGAHAREDFPRRDDGRFLKHTLTYKEGDQIRVAYKPVVITRFQPQERKY